MGAEYGQPPSATLPSAVPSNSSRPVSGLTSGRTLGSAPSRALAQWLVLQTLDSFTVAGAAPDLQQFRLWTVLTGFPFHPESRLALQDT